MKKLTLGLDQLEVDTFVAGPVGLGPGTVRAHDTDPQPIPGEDEVAPAKSWDTMCERTICFTCDRLCPSNATGCYTGNAPNCCV